MAKPKSRKKLIIWIVIAAVVLLGALGYLRMRSNLAAASRTTYDVVQVTRGDIEVTVKGSGSVEPQEEDTVYAASAATVDEVYFENGDSVKAGDVVAVLSSDTLEDQKSSLEQQIDDADAAIASMRSVSGGEYVYAPVEGTVMAVYAVKGESADVVTDRDGALAVICPDDLLKVKISTDAALTLGQPVTVTVDAQSVAGEVTAVADGSATVRFEDDGFALGGAVSVSAQDGAPLGEGAIEIANPVYVTGRGGAIERVYEKAGNSVSRGDKLFKLDGEVLSAALYEQIDARSDLQDDLNDTLADMDALTVKAAQDGVVTALDLNPGQAVQAGAPLFTVQSSGDYKIEVDIDELDIAGIELGEAATVTFDALPGESFDAVVSKINPVGVSVNNVTNYTVTLSLSQAPGVMTGMSAEVKIVAESAQNVLLVPIEAIQTIGGGKYVILGSEVDPEADSITATHAVVTGITDGVSIEIKEGLSESDSVAVPQVNSQDLQSQMWTMRQNAEGGSTQDAAESAS